MIDASAPLPARAVVPPVTTRVEEREGDRWRGTFVGVFDDAYAPLHRYLNRLCGDADLASDLAQEAFVRLYRRGALPDDPRAWLVTVATNLFRNARSLRANRARLLTLRRGLRVHSDPAPSPHERSEAVEARARVRAALDRLKERDRCLLLLAAEGYGYRETAGVLGVREGSVGTLLRRAREAFRRAYEERADAP